MVEPLDLYIDRIQDVVEDYPDNAEQRQEIRYVLVDVVQAVIKGLTATLPPPTNPPKGDVLGTYTREGGIEPL